MSNQKDRVKSIRVILCGSKDLGTTVEYPLIIGEFESVLAANKISDERNKLLMKVLFSTRALDTSLRTFIREKCNCWGIAVPAEYSLGDYLIWLSNNPVGTSVLKENNRLIFKEKIVNERNKYMHKAGEYPRDEAEINKLLIEMETCLAQVISFSL